MKTRIIKTHIKFITGVFFVFLCIYGCVQSQNKVDPGSIGIHSIRYDTIKTKNILLRKIIDTAIDLSCVMCHKSYFSLTVDSSMQYIYYFDGKRIFKVSINNLQTIDSFYVAHSIPQKNLATTFAISKQSIALILLQKPEENTNKHAKFYKFIEFTYDLQKINERILYLNGWEYDCSRVTFYSYFEDTLHNKLFFNDPTVNGTIVFVNDTLTPVGDGLADVFQNKVYSVEKNTITYKDEIVFKLSDYPYIPSPKYEYSFYIYNNKIFFQNQKYEYEFNISSKQLTTRIKKRFIETKYRFNNGTSYVVRDTLFLNYY